MIDGGTLEITAGLVSKRTVNIGAAGATIDVVVAGEVNKTELKGQLKGAIGGSGGLVKEGDGILFLNLQSNEYSTDGVETVYASNNTYVGKTVVKAGVLEVNTVEHSLGAVAANIEVELVGGNLKVNDTST